MKDENDCSTVELLQQAECDAQRRVPPAGKPKRLGNPFANEPPEGARPELKGFPLGFGRSVVPVSAVARDWGISARRVRAMLVERRLDGRQLENGYWEVYFPYRYIFGTRGPAIKRQQKREGKPE